MFQPLRLRDKFAYEYRINNNIHAIHYFSVVVLCVSPTDEHNILFTAVKRGMDQRGGYVYISLDHLPPSNVQTPWTVGGVENENVVDAYHSVLQVGVLRFN